MSKVSVIIAAYNVEKYIAETLNSVVAQTLKDIDIVVVDDCSTDKTFEIISRYAELDSRIKIVRHEVNSSVNISRVTGVKHAEGEYVIYIDGDDMLTPDACEKAYKAVTSEKVDVLKFDFEVVFEPPMLPNKNTERDLREIISSAENKLVSISKAGLLDEKAVGDTVGFTIWDKIYKRSVLEQATANVPKEYLNMAEDVLLSFLIQYHARSYSCISDRLYRYRFGCGVSTTSAVSDRILGFIGRNAFIYNYMDEWVKNAGTQKECELALKRVHQKLFTHIVSTYFYRANAEQKVELFSTALKYCDPSDLILALSDQVYNNTFTADLVAKECAGLEMFSAKRTEAKTIGVYYFRVYNGGVENVISSLTDMWIKSGYNVVLFTDEPPHKDDYYINPAVKRVVVPKLSKRDFDDRRNRINVFRKALIENNVDVMVYNAWVSPDLLLDEMIIKSCGVNLIIHTHSMFCCEADCENGMVAYNYSVLHKIYSFADTVVAISEVDAAWWNTMGLRSFKTMNPVQLSRDTAPSPLNGNNILFVGRISEEKRVIDAIKIAELVQRKIPDAKLTIVGKGDDITYINEVKNYISENRLGGVVEMVGFHSNVVPFYQKADVLLSTSRFEGCPLTPLEAKICGVPMVCYEIPSLDIVRNGKGMLIVDQRDIEAAAEAVIKILSDNEFKKKMGNEARESIDDFYGADQALYWENIFKQTLLPKPEAAPLYTLPTGEAAARIAMEKYGEGIFKRANIMAMHTSASAMSARCEELEKELERFKHSESYRIGMMITYIPRKIKNFLKRLLRRR